jgi:DNA polymerase I-like protein with 3'-5' exonuclease and polymerase domains
MGLAFQTITKHGDIGTDIRSLFIPDEGYILVEPDLSQAEARVVAILARDDKLLKMFQYGVDIHRVTSAWVLERKIPLLDAFFSAIEPEKCWEIANELNRQMKEFTNDDERQKGKKFRHAGHYDMGKKEAASQIGISESKAAMALTKFHITNTNIKGVFHREIIDFLNHNNRMLTNPYGRQRQFLNKWGDELFKEAYAQIPQSTVSDHVKFAMIRIEKRVPELMILEESHDSYLGQVPILSGAQYPFKILDRYRDINKEEMEMPIDFKNCSLSRGELIIPTDLHIGKESWEKMETYA